MRPRSNRQEIEGGARDDQELAQPGGSRLRLRFSAFPTKKELRPNRNGSSRLGVLSKGTREPSRAYDVQQTQ